MTLQLNTFRAALGAVILFAASNAGSVRGQSAPPASGAPQGTFQTGAGGYPYKGYETGYPAPEVQAVPAAYARSIEAREVQEQMLSELHATVDRLREDFNYSPDMLAAVREQDQAYFAYDDARRKVLESLSSDPTYRAMISLVVSLKQKLEDERPSAKPSEDDLERILATATLKLSYASAASAMEVAALDADSDVMQTHARLINAANKIGQMRADFEREIRRSPEFLAARRNLDEARITSLTAEAFLNGTLDARSVALDYAYYLRGGDQYSYASSSFGYGAYPYPYGYGYGYTTGYSFGHGHDHDHDRDNQ